MLHQCELILPIPLRCTVGRPSFFFFSGRRATIHFFLPRAAGRQSISLFFAPLGANLYYLHSSRLRAPIHFIFTPRTAGRQSISSFPRTAGRFTKSNLFQFADGRSSRIIAPTGDHQESLRQRASIKNHPADGRLSTIIVPTDDYQQSSRRRAIITNHRVDGRPANLILASRRRAILIQAACRHRRADGRHII